MMTDHAVYQHIDISQCPDHPFTNEHPDTRPLVQHGHLPPRKSQLYVFLHRYLVIRLLMRRALMREDLCQIVLQHSLYKL